MRPVDFFDTAAETRLDQIALVEPGRVRVSFRELKAASEHLAAALGRVVGAEPPAPIAILSPNDYRVLVCTLGIMRAGAVVMPLHVRNSVERNLRFLNQIEARCVFYHSDAAADVAAIRHALTAPATWVCIDRDCGADPSLAAFVQGAGTFVDHWGDVFGNPARPVYIRQTSGTTGEPKVIVGDIGSYAATHVALQHHLGVPDCRPVCLVPTPLSHAAGVHAFATLTIGGSLVILRDFDASDVLRAIEEYRVTHVWLPPSALYLLLACPDLGQTDLSSLKSVVIGTASVSPDRLKEAVTVFGPCVAVNYAQIEGGFLTWFDAKALAAAVAGDHAARLQSSGTSMSVSRVAIMDEGGALMAPGQAGEIVVRGRTVKPYITRLYVEDVNETAESRKDGWHHTGDLGRLDDDGYLYVVGRKKDTVNTAGFKVSAAEVERVIMQIAAIVECAVIGVPDTVRGEAVKAIVVVRPGHAVTEREILTHCRARLGRLHSPVTVEQWPELPKSAVGKIDKPRIRASFWARAVQ